jgi:hypothetical protein
LGVELEEMASHCTGFVYKTVGKVLMIGELTINSRDSTTRLIA